MSELDWIVIAMVALSVLLGIVRGFVREVISVAGWIIGVWLAFRYAAHLGSGLPFAQDLPLLQTGIAAVLIVVVCVFGAALTGWIARQLLTAAKLSAADRTLGALFGLARALAIAALVILLARDTELRNAPWWRESVVMAQLEAALRYAVAAMPVKVGS